MRLWVCLSGLLVVASLATARAQDRPLPPLRTAGPVPVSIAPTVPIEPPPSEAVRLFQEGRALLKDKRYAEASTALTASAAAAQAEGRANEERALIEYLLALSKKRSGQSAEALAAMRRSIEFYSSDADVQLDLGQLLFEQRQFVEAKRAAEEALRLGLSDLEDQKDARTLVRIANVRALLYDGKDLLRARKSNEAAAKLTEAAKSAKEAQLSDDEQALIRYLQGLALARSDRDEAAISALRAALQLAPDDTECRLELAQILFRNEEYGDAQKEAEDALRRGLADADDQKDARTLIKTAKTEWLRQRFSADVYLSFGYDSNVLEGDKGSGATTITIGGTCASCGGTKGTTGGTTSASRQDILNQLRSQQMLIQNLFSSYTSAITGIYNTPTAAAQEWDLPLTLDMELGGRIFGKKTISLWTGYRFYQYLVPSAGYDHDAYNIQEHRIPLYLHWQPTPWLRIYPRLEAVFQFTGLKQFTPSQGGLQADLDLTFLEGLRWRTRLHYQHQLRRPFDDQTNAILSADRDEVKLTQELRLRTDELRVRGQLSYRFRDERMGTYVTTSPFQPSFLVLRSGMLTPTDVDLGEFTYNAPLGYIGNEVATRWRTYLRHEVELGVGLAYEYRTYGDLYTASFSPVSQQVREPCPPDQRTCDAARQPIVTLPPAGTASPVPMPSEKRRDSLFTVDLSVLKRLPLGFSLELYYAFVHDSSSIANALDNRSYNKHTLNLTAGYSF